MVAKIRELQGKGTSRLYPDVRAESSDVSTVGPARARLLTEGDQGYRTRRQTFIGIINYAGFGNGGSDIKVRITAIGLKEVSAGAELASRGDNIGGAGKPDSGKGRDL